MKLATTACLLLSIFVISCGKEGLGGKSSLVTHVERNGNKIVGATIYIKYGANKFPGTDISEYDNHLQLADTGHKSEHVHFAELEKGNYYLYAVGYDSSIAKQVSGGLSIKLGKAEEKEVTVIVE